MKSLFFAMTISLFSTLSMTACSSDSKKVTAPEVTAAAASNAKATTADATSARVAKVDKAVTKAKKSVVTLKNTLAPVTAAGAAVLPCTNGSDVRTVEVKSTGGGCELIYTKHGEAKSIATAKNGIEYCAGVSQKLAKNLNTAGFVCK